MVVALAVFAFAGCAASPSSAHHSFSFDGGYDKWASDVDLLEYDYGGQYSMVRRKATDNSTPLGSRTGVHGMMPVGEFIFVKWRIKSTGEIRETRVDLRDRLPRNMFEHGVTFVIEGQELYVYLITPTEKKYMTPPVLRSWLSKSRVSYELYPTNNFNK